MFVLLGHCWWGVPGACCEFEAAGGDDVVTPAAAVSVQLPQAVLRWGMPDVSGRCDEPRATQLARSVPRAKKVSSEREQCVTAT